MNDEITPESIITDYLNEHDEDGLHSGPVFYQHRPYTNGIAGSWSGSIGCPRSTPYRHNAFASLRDLMHEFRVKNAWEIKPGKNRWNFQLYRNGELYHDILVVRAKQ